MACKDKNGNPCGCNDAALTTAPPCDTSGECTPNVSACAESFCLNCIAYCEEDMEAEVGGETFILKKGQNLNSIVQALIATMNDPQCGAYTAVDLRVTNQGEDSITIAWDSLQPINITIDWGTGTSPLLSDTVKQYTISGLTSNTEYRVKILTNGVPCASVTLITKTL